MIKSFAKLSSTLLLGLLQVSSSTSVDKKRKLAPQDFGEIHNQICFQVRDRFAQKLPESRAEVHSYITEELFTFCDDDDVECQMKMHQMSLNSQFYDSRFPNYEDVMPFNLDDMELKNTLKDIGYAIDSLENMEVEDIKDTINMIVEEYKEKEEDQNKHFLVESVASVATASTELWTGVFSDPEDAFYQYYLSRAQDHGDRKLQDLTAMVDVIQADVVKALETLVFPVITGIITGVPDINPLAPVLIALDSLKALISR